MVNKSSKADSTFVEMTNGNVVTITIVAEVDSAVHKAVVEAYRTNCSNGGREQDKQIERFVNVAMRCAKHLTNGKCEDDVREYANRYWNAHRSEADAAMVSKRERKKFVALRIHDMWEEEIFNAELDALAIDLQFTYRGRPNPDTTRRYMHPKA